MAGGVGVGQGGLPGGAGVGVVVTPGSGVGGLVVAVPPAVTGLQLLEDVVERACGSCVVAGRPGACGAGGGGVGRGGAARPRGAFVWGGGGQRSEEN